MYKCIESYYIEINQMTKKIRTTLKSTKNVTITPCQLVNNQEKNIDITYNDKCQYNSTDIIFLELKNFLEENEKVYIWIEQEYRSLESENSLDYGMMNTIIFFECQIGRIVKYGNATINNLKETLIENIINLRNRVKLKIENSKKYTSVPYVFEAVAAAVVSHEIIGHIFEIDNYYSNNYSSLIHKISKLKLNISDDPKLFEVLGLENFDDAMQRTTEVVIFNNGEFTGELIGGSVNSRSVYRNLRRSSFSVQALPRMSSISISANSTEIQRPDKYILISNVQRASVNHRTNKVRLAVTDAKYLQKGEVISYLSPFVLEIRIADMIDGLAPLTTAQNLAFITKCYKKGQVINAGIKTTDWLLG